MVVQNQGTGITDTVHGAQLFALRHDSGNPFAPQGEVFIDQLSPSQRAIQAEFDIQLRTFKGGSSE